MTRLALCLSCFVVLAACDNKDAGKPAATPAAKPGAKGTDKPAAAKGPGLNDPANDPKIVALAKKALECKWANNAFDSECADFKAWQAETDLFADHKGDGTLVAFMEDPDEKVRSLVLKRFFDWGTPFTDNALAARLVTVAEKSKAQNEMYPLGNVLGHVVLTDTALLPRIKALITSTTVSGVMRSAIVMYLMKNNPENEDVFNLTRDAVKDTDNQVKGNAIGALSMSGTSKMDDARCDVFQEHLDDADDGTAGNCAEYLGSPRLGCQSHYDALLKSFDARVKAKKMKPQFLNALRLMCGPNGATPAQLKTATALSHKLADDKTAESTVRVYALDAALACDPKGSKAYFGKFKKDKDAEVKATAARLSKPKK